MYAGIQAKALCVCVCRDATPILTAIVGIREDGEASKDAQSAVFPHLWELTVVVVTANDTRRRFHNKAANLDGKVLPVWRITVLLQSGVPFPS